MPRPKGREYNYRVTVNLSDEHYAALNSLAEKNQAAIAWTVRRAVMEFITKYDSDLLQERFLPLEEG